MIKILGIGLAVMTLLLIIAGSLLKNSYKANGALEGKVLGLQAEVSFQKEVGTLNIKHNKELANVTKDARKQSNDRIAILDLQAISARARSERNGLEFGNNIHVIIARVMCRIQADTDTKAYDTCISAPDEAFIGDISLTITVTDETLKDWKSGCFTYRQHADFTVREHEEREETDLEHQGILDLKNLCAPISITGFTPAGTSLILRYLEQLEAKSLEKSIHIDGLHSLIEKLQDPNFGLPKKE